MEKQVENSKARRGKQSQASGLRLVKTTVLLVLFFGNILKASATENDNDILVVTNSRVIADKITLAEIRDFFLKKKANWEDGTRVIPINAPPERRICEEFRGAVLQMSDLEIKRYWEMKKIRDGITEPPVFEKVLKAVFKLRGAIGYVYRSRYVPGVVKVIMVIPAKEKIKGDIGGPL